MSEYTELRDNLWVVFRKSQIQVYQESKWARRCSLSSSCSLFALLTHFLSNPFLRCHGTLSTSLSFLSFFGDKRFSFQPCGCHDRGPKTVSKVYSLFFCCWSFSLKSVSTLSAQHFSVFSFQFWLCSAGLFPRSCKLWTQFLPDLTDFPWVPKDEFNLHEVFINHLVLSHFHHYHHCSMTLYIIIVTVIL